MSKFKKGDLVRRLTNIHSLKVGEVYEVEGITWNGNLCIGGLYYDKENFELVTGNERIRKEITDAITTLAYYDLWRGITGFVNNSSSVIGFTLSEYLDKHYPLKTPQQLEIESIRKQQEKLAERLRKLEEE